MIASLYYVESLEDGIESGCSSVLYFNTEGIANISFLIYKTSKSYCNANFTYSLSIPLSNHIQQYMNEFNIIQSNNSKKRIKRVSAFWKGNDGKDMSNYRLSESDNEIKFANKNNAFIMMFKSYYYQRSKKLITPTTLRKSFVTHLKRIGDEKILDEAAVSMLHSKRVQEQYYTKLTSTEKATNISKFMKDSYNQHVIAARK